MSRNRTRAHTCDAQCGACTEGAGILSLESSSCAPPTYVCICKLSCSCARAQCGARSLRVMLRTRHDARPWPIMPINHLPASPSIQSRGGGAPGRWLAAHCAACLRIVICI